MRGKIHILLGCIGIFAAVVSLYGITIGINMTVGLIAFSVALVGFAFTMSKFTDLNYTPKKPALNYE